MTLRGLNEGPILPSTRTFLLSKEMCLSVCQSFPLNLADEVFDSKIHGTRQGRRVLTISFTIDGVCHNHTGHYLHGRCRSNSVDFDLFFL